MKTEATPDFSDVFDAEKKRLQIEEGAKVSGLAISGGGIRSASFGLGVMQALVANDQLKKMDYMSTVSGGGYLGSALTWALKQGGKEAGTRPENFPLGKKGTHARHLQKDMNEGFLAKNNHLLDFIRQHATYLTPVPSLDMISFVAVVMRSMMMSLFVYFSFLSVIITGFIWLFDYLLQLSGMVRVFPAMKGILIPIGLGLFLIIFIKGFLYSLKTFMDGSSGASSKYLKFIRGQKSIGRLMKVGIICLIFGTLPYIGGWAVDVYKKAMMMMVASGSTLFGAIIGLWQYKKAQNKEKGSSTSSNILIYLGAFSLFYGIILMAYLFGSGYFINVQKEMVHPIAFFSMLLLSLIFGFFVNLNLIGPHRIWRNRLMEAFMPDKEAVKTNEWGAAKEADAALIEDMCDEHNPRPYHLVNTNIILANSEKVKFKGRGGDNFILSPLYCGSDATSWRTTSTFQKHNSRGMTLATAMATSAAALNPSAAVSGEGVTRNTVISILLSMLNLRLGYWTSNPGKEKSLRSPNFIVPGFTSEIFRNGLSEKNSDIQLSDGGHFENLAFYELIRRKLDLIVVSDGGADPTFNFDDLANAIEKVRVDFGAKITFRKEAGLDAILPRTSGDSEFQKKYDLAKQGHAFADIEYSDQRKGILVYVKLAMIEGLPVDVYSYKGMHPSFPHQSTSDQFFDEKQFEAYRELGYNVGWQMMESETGKEIFK